MAIVRRSAQPEPAELEAIVVSATRPAFLIRNDQVETPPPGLWHDEIESQAKHVTRAIRGTARLEISDQLLPYVGTAFIVGPRLAAIAKHMAEILLHKERTNEGKAGTPFSWLNFYAEHGSEQTSKIGVRVKLVHPYFDFALLDLDEEVEADRVLSLSTAAAEPDQSIFVVGYPALDVRNEQAAMSAIFGDIYGVKRLMPGKILKQREEVHSFGNMVPALSHDASTLGGTAGAPVVCFETGDILGENFAGFYLKANFAVPAMELARDPYVRQAGVQFSDAPPWLHLWQLNPLSAESATELPKTDEEELPRQIVGGATNNALKNIFTFDQIIELHEQLIEARFVTDEDLAKLFDGLPSEFIAALPGGGTLSEKLLARLNYFNRFGALIPVENHTPFYLILRAAKSLRRVEPTVVEVLDRLLDVVKKAEAKAAKRKT